MSGCGCGQSAVAANQYEPAAATGAQELEDWFSSSGETSGLSGPELFLSLTEAGAAVPASDELAELAQVEQEEELAALQELDAAMQEESGSQTAAEPGLDELLALLRKRPGLKITFSY